MRAGLDGGNDVGVVFAALEASRAAIGSAAAACEDAHGAAMRAVGAARACDPAAAAACGDMLDAWSGQLGHLWRSASELGRSTGTVIYNYRRTDDTIAAGFES
jgi:hypothetical protein